MKENLEKLINDYERNLSQLEKSILRQPYSGYYQGCEEVTKNIIDELETILNEANSKDECSEAD